MYNHYIVQSSIRQNGLTSLLPNHIRRQHREPTRADGEHTGINDTQPINTKYLELAIQDGTPVLLLSNFARSYGMMSKRLLEDELPVLLRVLAVPVGRESSVARGLGGRDGTEWGRQGQVVAAHPGDGVDHGAHIDVTGGRGLVLADVDLGRDGGVDGLDADEAGGVLDCHARQTAPQAVGGVCKGEVACGRGEAAEDAGWSVHG